MTLQLLHRGDECRCGCCNDVDCFGGRPLPAVFRADFLGGMISHLYSNNDLGSTNIKIVKFIFLASM